MNRRAFIYSLATAIVASSLLSVLAVEPEWPVMTLEEVAADFVAQTTKMLAEGTISIALTNQGWSGVSQ